VKVEIENAITSIAQVPLDHLLILGWVWGSRRFQLGCALVDWERGNRLPGEPREEVLLHATFTIDQHCNGLEESRVMIGIGQYFIQILQARAEAYGNQREIAACKNTTAFLDEFYNALRIDKEFADLETMRESDDSLGDLLAEFPTTERLSA
jgi:hypothetical protein